MPENIQPHILVVDDDPQIRDLLQEYLTQNELRVSVTSTGKEMSQPGGATRKATGPEKTDGSARFSWGSELRKQ